MKEKTKCKKCGLLIDEDLKTCPYCGFEQVKISEEEEKPLIKEEKVEPKKKINLFDFPSRVLDVGVYKNASYLIVGILLLQILAFVFKNIAFSNPHFAFNNVGGAAINFAVYFIIFGAMILITNKDITKITNDYKHGKTWILGLGFGFLLMIVSSAVSLIFKSFAPNTGVNVNEQSVDAITSLYPLLSLIVFGFLGPICEEFTYRAGLFTLLKKANRVLAYVATAILFGLIHFNFQAIGTESLVTELINIPSYIVSGILLCYFYDYAGLSASIIAHCVNNVVAVLLQIYMSLI